MFEGFNTESQLFQPEIENAESAKSETDTDIDEETSEEEDNKRNETDTKTQRTYGAQYPYTETTSRNAESVQESQQQSYQGNDGVQHTVTSRRVVLAGRGSDTPDNRQYSSHTTRTEVEYHQPSQSSGSRTGNTPRTGDSSYSNQYGYRYPSNSRTMVTNRRVYTGSGTNQQYNRYNTGTSRTEVRGAPYNGPRYIDNNGHYVDAQGRHLDSTGRYYDVSGRYNDATMTRMQTFQHVYSGNNGGLGQPSRTTYNTGTNSGYYNNNRRYTSRTGSSNGYYDSSGRFIPYQSGTVYSNQGGGGSSSSYVDADRSRPVNSYGGTQFYSGGSSYQTTYDPITSQISSESVSSRICIGYTFI